MSVINIKLSHIRSVEIIHIPTITVTGPMFQFANIAWLRTVDGGDYELLFDQKGEPLVDRGLTERVGRYYGKTFQAIVFDGRPAYAQVNKGSEKTGPKHATTYPRGGSNPYHSKK